MQERRPLLEVLAAALLFGTTGTARALGAKHAPALGVGAARLLIGGGGLIVIARLSGHDLRHETARRFLVLAGLLTAVYQLAFFAALDRTGVAVGTVVTIGSGPPLAGLLGMASGQGRPSRRWLVATLLAISGVALLANPSGGVNTTGVGLALLSGLGYAGYTVVAKSLMTSGSAGAVVMAWAFGVGGLLMVPALIATGPGWLVHPKGAATALYLGLLPTTLAYVLFARGLARLSAATVTTVVLAEPLVAALLGVVVLGEHLGVGESIGCALVLTGLLVIATERSA